MTDHATMAAEQLRHELEILAGVQARLAAVRTLDDRLPARVATAIEWIRAARGKLQMTLGLMGEIDEECAAKFLTAEHEEK